MSENNIPTVAASDDRLHLTRPSLTTDQWADVNRKPLSPEMRALIGDMRTVRVSETGEAGARQSWWSMIGQMWGLFSSLFSDEKGPKR